MSSSLLLSPGSDRTYSKSFIKYKKIQWHRSWLRYELTCLPVSCIYSTKYIFALVQYFATKMPLPIFINKNMFGVSTFLIAGARISSAVNINPLPSSMMNPSLSLGVAEHMERGADFNKIYCQRAIIQQTDCLNTSVLDCSVTFMVDRNICLLGVQVCQYYYY